MAGLLIAVAVVLAVAAVSYRRWQQARELAQRPGASLARAIPVERFDEIEILLAGRQCACGHLQRFTGEGSQQLEERRFRVAHLTCPECGRDDRVFFDVTQAFQ